MKDPYEVATLIVEIIMVGSFVLGLWFQIRKDLKRQKSWKAEQWDGGSRSTASNGSCGSIAKARYESAGGAAGAHGANETRPFSVSFGSFDFGHSSAYGGGYSGPSVNTNGAPMCGSTDIYGNSFGASASSSLSINRWD